MAFFPSESNSTSAPPAPRLSQYDEENPIIHEQTVRDKSQGLESISKTLGGISDAAMQMAGNLGEQESNAMFASSQAQLDTIKTNAKVEMIKNQGQASKIAQSTAEGYGTIIQQAVVNRSDRQKLMQSAATDLNSLRVEAATVEHGVAKRAAFVNFTMTWPSILSGLKGAIGNEKEYNDRLKSAQELLSTVTLSEAITPTQSGNYYKSLQAVISSSHQFMRAASDNTLTAKGYHELKNGVVQSDDGTHMGQPIDHNTAHLYSSQANDLTKKTLMSEIASGGNGNPAAWGELSNNSVASDEMFSYAHGAHMVDAHINSGSSMVELANELKRLDAKGTLSTQEQGWHDRAKNILSDMGEGRTNVVMANNPIWRETESNYNKVSAAIDASGQSAEQKAALHTSYFNDLIWKRASLMDAMHIPSDMQHPLPPEFIESSKAAWANGKDAAPLLVHADQLRQENKEYLATGQDTPIHQEVTRIVANIKGGIIPRGLLSGNSRITDGDRRDWIVGNQTGHAFSDLKIKTDVGDQPIMQDIQNGIGDTLKFIGVQSSGSNRGVAVVQAATNYVKYLAQKNGDFTLDNKKDYVKKAVAMVNAAYPQARGMNWNINTNDIPADAAQMDKIAAHRIDQAQIMINERFGKDRGTAMTAANSLTVISTATGHLVVVDAYGKQLSETKYNDRMGDYVDSVNAKKEQEKSGMIEKGNIDLSNRQKVQNPDGSYSTVRTITAEVDGSTVLLPTIIGGKQVSNEEAIEHYKKTGEHMGKFSSEEAANRYDEKIHKEQGWTGKNNKWNNPEEVVANQEEQTDDDLKENEKLRERGKKQAKKLDKAKEKAAQERGNA